VNHILTERDIEDLWENSFILQSQDFFFCSRCC